MSERGESYRQQVDKATNSIDQRIEVVGTHLVTVINEYGILFASTPEERMEANLVATQIIESFGFGFHTIEDAKLAKRDSSKTEDQKKNADMVLKTMAYSLIKCGLENDELAAVLALSPSGTDNRMPDAFKGNGEAIINLLYEDKTINKAVKKIDERRSKLDDKNIESVRGLRDQVNAFLNLIMTNTSDDADLFNAYATEEIEQLDARIQFLEKGTNRPSGAGRRVEDEDEDLLGATFVPSKPVAEGEEGGQKGKYERPGLYGPAEDPFTTALMEGGETDYDFKRNPSWVEKLDKKEQALIRVMSHLSEISAIKQSLGGNLDKLTQFRHEKMAMYFGEFALLEEIPAFRQASKMILTEIFELIKEKNGVFYLHLKSGNFEDEDKRKHSIDERAYWALKDMQSYLEITALRIDKPELSYEEAKEKAEKHELAGNRTRRIVATAWNFIYDFDTVESADVNRDMHPERTRDEKIASIMHPRSKIKDKITGKDKTEEISMGGVGLFYVRAAIEVPGFRELVLEGKGLDLIPERIGSGMLDMMEVKVDGKKMSLAQAMINGYKVDIKAVESKWTTKWTKDVFPGIAALYQIWSQSKDVPFSYTDSKVRKNWIDKTFNALSYLRQNRSAATDSGLGGYFDVLDDPNFYAFLLAGSVGLKQGSKRLLLNFDSREVSNDGYDVVLNDIFKYWNLLDKIDPDIDKKQFADQVKKILNGSNILKYWISNSFFGRKGSY